MSVYVCPSSLQRWSINLLVGFTDPYDHTYSESLWWKLLKNHKRTQIQRQWQRQRQRQSAWDTQHMLYFWNPNDSLISNMMMIPTPSPSCSYWSPFFGHRINSRGPSVSPFSWFSRYELSGTDLPYSKGFRKFGCPELSKKSLTLIQLFFVGGAFDPDPDADPYEILVSPPNYFFFPAKRDHFTG